MAVPLVIGAGVWAYRGYQVYRAYRVYQMAQRLEKAAKAAAKPMEDVCATCDPRNRQRCDKLSRRIEGKVGELKKRGADLINDPSGGTMPYAHILDHFKPSKSIRGHERMFRDHRQELQEALEEHKKLGCQPPPSEEAWRLSQARMPFKGETYRLPEFK